ncbi:MAG: choice-of-anchor I family protein [Spongiibacter sp.]|nr:choice-of-anchor I family protein [Spongiibacter sp.]
MIERSKVSGKKVALLGAAIAALTACSGDNNSSGRTLTYELNPRQFIIDESLGSVQFNGAAQPISLHLSVGSGAYRSPAEEGRFFYTITDRGPTFPCSDSQQVIGVQDFCGAGNSGSVFALPDFAPRIQSWKLSGIGTGLRLEMTESLTLKDTVGNELNGLPNPTTQAVSEQAYDASGATLAKNANGIDPEALVKLDNGRFWVAEEYGPSLLLVDVDGKVLQRQVPAGTAGDFGAATYPVQDTYLPAILARRQLDRGIEALALSPDNDFLYFVVQAPLLNPDVATAERSRIVRIGKLSLNEDGTINSLVGEYLYRLDTPSQFARKSDGKGDLANGEFLAQSAVTINEAVAVGEDYLVLVEQARSVSKYYRVNLENAVSILGTQWDQFSSNNSLEQQYLVDDVPFVTKQLGYDTLSKTLPVGIDPLGENVEGLALLNANFTAVTNDSRYGLYGEQSRVAILPLGPFIVATAAPEWPVLSYDKSASFRRSDANFGAGAARTLAVDSVNAQMFVVNGQSNVVDVVDITTPLTPVAAGQIDTAAAAADAGVSLGAITGVTVGVEYVAVAIEHSNPQQNGIVALYNRDELTLAATFTVGAGPKMLTFDIIGQRVLVANEGRPSADYSVDPEGSVTLIDLSDGLATAEARQITFAEFNVGGARHNELPASVRVYGPGASVAQDLEPEHISVAADNDTVFVGLQENNAMAVLDLSEGTIEAIYALGTKDYGVVGNEVDVNDDGNVILKNWLDVAGMYQPDGVAAYRHAGANFVLTANEGEARNYSGFSEEFRASELDGVSAPAVDAANRSFADAGNNNELGRLKVTDQTGDTDGDGDIDIITAFGARSFAVWDASGNLVYDSGAELERMTFASLGANFNNTDANSDDRGPEPESVALLALGSRVYAFIGLTATGGIAVYDVSSPYGVQFVQYLNNRDFTANPAADTGDQSPEGLHAFYYDNVPYLAVGHEASGNVRIFEISLPSTTSN